MTWLAALSGEGGLPVPAPVPALDGKLVLSIATPGIPDGRIVSLMRWIDGHPFTRRMQSTHAKAWGRMVGRLHAFAATWKPPEGFDRFLWDWEGLLGGRGMSCGVDELVSSMPTHLREPFQSISRDAREVMASLGRTPEAFGLIHTDMYPGNVLFKDGEVFPIDFEDCGFGYWLWDIAVPLEAEPWTDAWRRRRDDFLDGYLPVHPLPDSQLQHLDLFLAMDYATSVLWAASFIHDDPSRQDEYVAWMNENGEKLLRYFEC
jgi:Ser/Thr protein kinase RdoA (MazF antagonist)